MPTDYTAKASLPSPQLSNTVNVPADIQALAAATDSLVIPKYANATAMNAANPSPVAGDMCYRTDLRCHLQYSSTASGWRVMGTALFAQGQVASVTGTITISSIPQIATNLKLVLYGRTQENTAFGWPTMRLNGVSSTIYNELGVTTDNGSGPGRVFNSSITAGTLGIIPGGTFQPNGAGFIETEIPYYSATAFNKTWMSRSICTDGGAIARSLDYRCQMYNYTAPVTQIQLIIPVGFAVGTRYTLYGLP